MTGADRRRPISPVRRSRVARSRTATQVRYGRHRSAMAASSAGVDELADVAERWAPYRSWAALLIRADGEPAPPA